MGKFLTFKIVVVIIVLVFSVFAGLFFVLAQNAQQQLSQPSGPMGTGGFSGFIPPPPPSNYVDPVYESVSQKWDEGAPLQLKATLKQRQIFTDSYDDYHGDKLKQDLYVSTNKSLSSVDISVVNTKTGEVITEYNEEASFLTKTFQIPKFSRSINISPWKTLLPDTGYEYTVIGTSKNGNETATIRGSFRTDAQSFKRGPISLSVVPSKEAVMRGESFEIRWDAPNADVCQVYGFKPMVSSETVGANGSRTLIANVEYELFYEIFCKNFTHETRSYFHIPVITDPNAPTPEISLGTSQTSIDEGEKITLSWSVKKQEDCVTNVAVYDPDNKDWIPIYVEGLADGLYGTLKQPKGKMVFLPEHTTSYALVCWNKHKTTKKNVIVVVDEIKPESPPQFGSIPNMRIETSIIDPDAPTPRISLRIEPGVIKKAGDKVSLSLDVADAEQCSLSSWAVPAADAKKSRLVLRKLSAKNYGAINGYVERLNVLDENPTLTFTKATGRNTTLDILDELNSYLGIDKDADYSEGRMSLENRPKDKIPLQYSEYIAPKSTSFYTVWCQSGMKIVRKTVAVIVDDTSQKAKIVKPKKKR